MIRYVFKLSNRDGAVVQESTYHAGPYDGPRVFGDFAADRPRSCNPPVEGRA
jgi:hypothetical protein